MDQIYTALRTVIMRMEENQQEDIKKKENAKILREYHMSTTRNGERLQISKFDRLINFITKGSSYDEKKLKQRAEQERLKNYERFLKIKEKEAQSKQTEKSH